MVDILKIDSRAGFIPLSNYFARGYELSAEESDSISCIDRNYSVKTPTDVASATSLEWAEQDSNLRPLLCKRSALTN
jgi:hypothetical protein